MAHATSAAWIGWRSPAPGRTIGKTPKRRTKSAITLTLPSRPGSWIRVGRKIVQAIPLPSQIRWTSASARPRFRARSRSCGSGLSALKSTLEVLRAISRSPPAVRERSAGRAEIGAREKKTVEAGTPRCSASGALPQEKPGGASQGAGSVPRLRHHPSNPPPARRCARWPPTRLVSRRKPRRTLSRSRPLGGRSPASFDPAVRSGRRGAASAPVHRCGHRRGLRRRPFRAAWSSDCAALIPKRARAPAPMRGPSRKREKGVRKCTWK